jgi:hypothetical protein
MIWFVNVMYNLTFYELYIMTFIEHNLGLHVLKLLNKKEKEILLLL